MQEIALLYITSFFTMINPLGCIPLYIALTQGFSSIQCRKVVIKATVTAFILLTLLAFAGQWVFAFFNISIDGLKIVGGFIFFRMGYEMLSGRSVTKRIENESDTSFANEIAITPLAIPMICGPGAITMAILFMEQATDLQSQSILIGSIALVSILTGFMLLAGKKILNFLGDSGAKVMMRLMGLVVMLIGVEFFFTGVTPYVQKMLMITAG
ncbi:MarC family protein [Shewanella sp. AS1]|uniref:MarC family protein n=1 Tax=Shewanella sp. AS1 TaxID=2907626 RepID=UPI001F380A9D|nr:MarC family protein [Shewanella sp. AS1]MCE9679385.1 MarC family protein [Shewanella sp. AS1]